MCKGGKTKLALSKVITLTVRDHAIKLSNQIKFFQNDQVYLIFIINEYGINVKNGVSDIKTIMPINPLQATLYVETPLGVDNIESASIENNRIVFHLKSKYTQYIGVSKMQIKLTDKDCCQITLPHFEFEIKENIYDNEPLFKDIILTDENNNIVVDENGNVVKVGSEIYAKPLIETIPIEEVSTIQIKDFNLDTNITGDEDVLIQDKGITKRVKTSKLVKDMVLPEILLEDYYTKDDLSFDNNMITSTSIGGIKEGTDLSNMSMQDVLSKLLFPYVAPVASASIIKSPNKSICEYGEIIQIKGINSKVVKKSDKIISVNLLDETEVLKEFSNVENGGNFNFTFNPPINITSNLSNTRFRLEVVDASNNIIYANTSGINFYYPYYYGVIDENQPITSELFSTFIKKVESKGTKSNNYTTNNQCMIIAYPKSYGNLNKILDQNSFNVTNTFKKSEIDIIGLDGTSQKYYVYKNNASTVTNFKITFQY